MQHLCFGGKLERNPFFLEISGTGARIKARRDDDAAAHGQVFKIGNPYYAAYLTTFLVPNNWD